MSRETPIKPKISFLSLRSGTLVVRIQVVSPKRRGFLLVDHRLSRPNDPLLVGKILLSLFGRAKLEVGPTDQIVGSFDADPQRRRLVGDDEAAVDVLDPEIVWHLVDQGLQRNRRSAAPIVVCSGAACAGDLPLSRAPEQRSPETRRRRATGRRLRPRAARPRASSGTGASELQSPQLRPGRRLGMVF